MYADFFHPDLNLLLHPAFHQAVGSIRNFLNQPQKQPQMFVCLLVFWFLCWLLCWQMNWKSLSHASSSPSDTLASSLACIDISMDTKLAFSPVLDIWFYLHASSTCVVWPLHSSLVLSPLLWMLNKLPSISSLPQPQDHRWSCIASNATHQVLFSVYAHEVKIVPDVNYPPLIFRCCVLCMWMVLSCSVRLSGGSYENSSYGDYPFLGHP